MRNTQYYNLLGILLCSVFLINSGCKEDTIIKAKVVPGGNTLDPISVPDNTFNIISKTIFVDTFNSSEKLAEIPVIQGLGTFSDPYFGKTNAGIYFQVLPETNNFSFTPSGNFEIDSAVLILPYVGFSWGDRTNPQPQRFRVYRVTEPMDIATKYYSNKILSVDRQNPYSDITTVDLKSTITDSVIVPGDTVAAHMRIRLNDQFINDIKAQIGTSTFETEANFLSTFNGFYIEPDTTQNTNLLYYTLLDGGADYRQLAIAFYFREPGSSDQKVTFFEFNHDRATGTGKTANYNWISRNYTGTPAEKHINSYITSRDVSDDTILMQNEPGAAFDLRIQNIDQLPLSAIVKAEIVISKVSTGNPADSLLEPSRLLVKGVDKDGNIYTIQDMLSSNSSAAVGFVDGLRREEKDNAGNPIIRYRLNIPRELQKAIRDNVNELHLRITSAKGFPAAYRLVASGRNNSSNGITFNVVYSKAN